MKNGFIAFASALTGAAAGGALVKKVWLEKYGKQRAELTAAENERDALYTWLLLLQRGISPARYFQKRGFSRVAVLGMGAIGRLAIDALGESAAYGISTGDFAAVHEKLTVYRLGEDALPKADCVLICDLERVGQTAEQLRCVCTCEIVTLAQVLQSLLDESGIAPRDGAIKNWPGAELCVP